MESNENAEQAIKPIGVLSYMNIIILSLLPLFGLFYSSVWSFKPNVDKNRKNLSRAMLILQILFIAILAILIFYVWNNIVNPLMDTLNSGIVSTYSSNTINLEETFNEVKSSQDIDWFQYFNFSY